MSETPEGSDPLAVVRARVDELLNIDVPLMVSRGQLDDQQLFETIGVLSLWMRSVMGEVDGQTTDIIGQFVQAIEMAYAEDPRPLSEKLHGHIEAALRDNPALKRMRTHLEEAIAAVPDDPHVGATRAFLVYATRPTCDAEVMAYYDILLGLR